MRYESIPAQEALERGRKLPYALIRSLGGVTLGPAPEDVDLSELIEARFFDQDQEVRLFRDGGELRGAILAEREGEPSIRQRRKLANPVFGKAVSVCQVLDFDKDGQAYIACTRLTGWEGGA